ncbi:MAG: Bug family tripartite tricarboxylate transporter substrate binding protein, partial [Nocardioidaceae bacterium]
MTSRLRCAFAVCGATLLMTGCAALEDDPRSYPGDTVEVIFPFAAGSPGDVSARALAEQVEPALGEQIRIVNKDGAAGTAGLSEVAAAENDGYTLGFSPIAPLTIQPQISDLSYQDIDDFEPVIMISKQPEVLAVPADSPYDSLRDLIAIGKEMTIKVATTGRGTILDVDASLLAQQAGTDFSNVPFEGEQQALASLVGGTTDIAVSGATAAIPFEKSGDIRILGVFTDKPIDTFPDAPTLKSQGYDITFGVDNFVLAPKGTPDDVIDTLHDAFKKG